MTLTEQTNTTWDDERIETLRALWTDGQTASQIGEVLGCTRNAVIGKVHRLGITRDLSINRQEAVATAEAPHHERAARIAQQRNPQHLMEQAKLVAELAAKWVPGRPTHRKGYKTIFQLGPRDCRWPIGEKYESARMFCGNRAVPGKSYCSEHWGSVYVKTSKRVR